MMIKESSKAGESIVVETEFGSILVKPILEDGWSQLSIVQGDREYCIGYDEYDIIVALFKDALIDDIGGTAIKGVVENQPVSIAGHLYETFNSLYYSRLNNSVTFFVISSDQILEATLNLSRTEINHLVNELIDRCPLNGRLH